MAAWRRQLEQQRSEHKVPPEHSASSSEQPGSLPLSEEEGLGAVLRNGTSNGVPVGAEGAELQDAALASVSLVRAASFRIPSKKSNTFF